jgi:hypothetical protein
MPTRGRPPPEGGAARRALGEAAEPKSANEESGSNSRPITKKQRHRPGAQLIQAARDWLAPRRP